ncbi:MAG: hypothetical protein IJJ41_03850 [Clostridia bacterium]|nr:hypothetical protein [Clostridia bacterium]
MEVRTDYNKGDRLFDWEPNTDIITVIRKRKKYKIKLIRGTHTYTVIEEKTYIPQ